jgi:hypothetical protein
MDGSDGSDDSSTSAQPNPNYVVMGSVQFGDEATINKDQARRLRLVSSQAVLFVVCFLISNVWTVFTGLLEDQGNSLEADLTMLVRTFPIFVLQAIFSPLQGFLNMMVFIRPKYLKFRHLHQEESRFWVVKRSVFGEEVEPTTQPQQQQSGTKPPKQGVGNSEPSTNKQVGG